MRWQRGLRVLDQKHEQTSLMWDVYWAISVDYTTGLGGQVGTHAEGASTAGTIYGLKTPLYCQKG